MFLLRDDITEITAIINNGGCVCYPTDTVWGLGCDATNETAVANVRKLKQLPDQQGVVVLVDSIEMLKNYISDLPPRIETLLALHHRPFTLIYKKNHGLAPNVCAADGSVAIRVSYDEFSQFLIQSVGKPLVATGACLDQAPYPANFGAISSEILGKADYVVKYKQDDKSMALPSPIALLDQFQELEFIRE